jgi:glucokinase
MAELLKPGEYAIGMDIGGTKIMVSVFNHAFEEVGCCRKKTKTRRDVPASDRIFAILDEAIKSSGVDSVRAIGAGVPGPTDPVSGTIIDTPNLGWKDFPLGAMLQERYGVPVALDNDVNMGTYGEWSFGAVHDCEDVVGVFPGTGIGAGIIINRRLLHGFSGAAGEVGHMTIEAGGRHCGCGKRGCLEAVASRVAISAEVAALALRGDAPYIAEHCGFDLRKIKSGVLASAIAAGDSFVESVVRRAAYNVGIGVANVINLLSPEAIVLGGGLVEAMPQLYLEEVSRAVEEHAMPMLRKGVRIVPAQLGDHAVVLGAARMAVQRITE